MPGGPSPVLCAACGDKLAAELAGPSSRAAPRICTGGRELRVSLLLHVRSAEVGKSALTSRLRGGGIDTTSTLGVEFFTHVFKAEDGTTIGLDVRDSVPRSSFASAHCRSPGPLCIPGLGDREGAAQVRAPLRLFAALQLWGATHSLPVDSRATLAAVGNDALCRFGTHAARNGSAPSPSSSFVTRQL